MSIESMKQALEALCELEQDMFHPAKVFKHKPTITALRTAIEQAEKQGPVARLMRFIGKDAYPKKGYTVARTYKECPENHFPNIWEEGEKLYTTPPAAQRKWIGLTLKEFKQIEEKHIFVEDTIRFVEAKLKEKNT